MLAVAAGLMLAFALDPSEVQDLVGDLPRASGNPDAPQYDSVPVLPPAVVAERDATRMPLLKSHRELQPPPALAAAQKATKAQTATVAVEKSEATATAKLHAEMKSQCEAFAGYLKAQGNKGVALVRTVKGTCDPGVASGEAPPPYVAMCSALGSAVEQFANQPSWSPAALCEEVARVFKESGVGA
jgi:hypothetical protein